MSWLDDRMNAWCWHDSNANVKQEATIWANVWTDVEPDIGTFSRRVRGNKTEYFYEKLRQFVPVFVATQPGKPKQDLSLNLTRP